MVSQYLSGALAFFAPIVVSYLKSTQYSIATKQLIAVAVAIVLAFLCSLAEMENYWVNFGANVFITITMTQTAYHFIWERIKPVENKLRESGVKPKQ